MFLLFLKLIKFTVLIIEMKIIIFWANFQKIKMILKIQSEQLD